MSATPGEQDIVLGANGSGDDRDPPREAETLAAAAVRPSLKTLLLLESARFDFPVPERGNRLRRPPIDLDRQG